MGFFLFQLASLIVGALIHTYADRKPNRRTRYRVTELWLLWFVAGGGAWLVFAGTGHIGPNAPEIAEDIGFRHTPFQWEVGWADIAFGVLGFVCIWKRGSFMTAAVIGTVILLWGDAIGHVMQWVSHDNTAVDNTWAILPDVAVTSVSLVLLGVYRRLGGPRADQEAEAAVA
jgi:hypothetical protein